MKSTTQLSILIPCFNEAHRLPGTIDAVLGYLERLEESKKIKAELVLVDDGSTDETPSIILRNEEEHARVRGVQLPHNQGKGAAIKTGVKAIKGEMLVFFDADLSYPLELVSVALDELGAGADLVIGGRDLDPSARQTYSFARRFTSLAFNFIVDQFLGIGIPDTQCGFKAFRAPVAQAIFSNLTVERFGFDVELLYLARSWDLSIKRIPVQMTHRSGSSVRIVRDSFQMWRDTVKIWRNGRKGLYPQSLPTEASE